MCNFEEDKDMIVLSYNDEGNCEFICAVDSEKFLKEITERKLPEKILKFVEGYFLSNT